MIINYIKIAWRNLVSQKLFSFLNIGGLAAGLAVFMIIMLYVAHEHSYDRFHKNADRIYLPNAHLQMGDLNTTMEYTSFNSGPMISQSQPAVESYLRTLGYFRPVVVSNPNVKEQKFSEDKLVFSDPGFFKFFSFKLIEGAPADVLKRPFSVVLSAGMARKYFGTLDAIGRTLVLKTDSSYTYQVTGIAENAPSNSSITYNFIASMSSLQAMKEAPMYAGVPQIGPGSFNTYLLLNHAADTAKLRTGLNALLKNNKSYQSATFSLTSLTDSHLNSFNDTSNIKYLKIFPIVAVLILLLALVNYMSLSTARATLRAKEVGVRKVSGASRKTIALQFYTESAFFAVLSFLLGYVLCFAFKPWFLNVLQLKIDSGFFYSPLMLTLLGSLLVLVILAAGSYPSLVLSAFKPVITLKGKMSKQAGGIAVRKLFTILQFTIAAGLIICGIVIDRQLYFFRHADTGINRENVITLPVSKTLGDNYHAFLHDMQELSGISNLATSQHEFFKPYDMFMIDGRTKEEKTMIVAALAGENFPAMLGLKFRIAPPKNIDYSKSNKVFINELAVQMLHLPPNPIGSFIKSGTQKIEVAGVLKNFNSISMADEMKPMGLFIIPDSSKLWARTGRTLFARIKPHANLPTLLKSIQTIYKKYDSETPFSYSFMDDTFNEQYKAEDKLASIFSVFTGITIVLASLGLFGLAAFTIEQRTKEIGVRKVLGAGLASINLLLSRDFLKLVLIAVIIASPVAWWSMHNWLQNFAYRITISWWVFAVAGTLAVLTALITISYHSVRAAIANPVKSLRSE